MQQLSPPQPPAQFVHSLDAALAFWRLRLDTDSPSRLERDRHNLYRAVQLGLALPHTQPSAAMLAANAFSFVYARGYWREWLPVLEQAASVTKPAPAETTFWLLTRLGQLRRLNGKLADAVRAHRQALDVAREINQPLTTAEAHFHLGRALRDARHFLEAEQHLRAAHHTLQQEPDDSAATLAANVHNALGRVAHDLGRLADAQKHLAQAVLIRRRQAQPVPLADALHDLGNLHTAAGAFTEALACYEEALALLAGTDHRLNRILIQFSVGALHFARADYAQAENTFRQVDVPFLRETGNLHLQAILTLSLGNALLYQSRHEQAAQVLRESISLWQQLEDDLELANAVGSLGEVLAALGQKEEAYAQFSEALALLTRTPDSAKAGRLRAFFTAERAKVAGAGPQ